MEDLSYLPFSRHWARFLAANTNLTPEKEVIITYGIEVLVINLGNVLLTLLLGLLLGVLPETAACLGTVALFRHTAGGAHSNSPWRCAIITVILFPLLALLASFLSGLNHIYCDVITALAVLIALATIIVLAPVDTPAAPIISPVRRTRLKALSLAAIILVAATIVALGQSGREWAPAIRTSLSLSIIWVSFILSKTGNHAMAFIDGITLKKGGETI